MKRIVARGGQTMVDIALLAAAYFLAFFLRFDWDIPADMVRRLLFTLPYAVALQFGALMLFGVHRFSWRHVGLREVIRIGLALGIGSSVLLAARLLVGSFAEDQPQLRYALVPIGALVIDYMLGFVSVVGARALRRVTAEQKESRQRLPTESTKNVVVVGAGSAGAMVLREIRSAPHLGMVAVGVLDDDPAKHGTMIHGVEVCAKTGLLAKVVEERGASEVIIAIANASGTQIRRIAQLGEDAGVKVKIVPGLSELVGGSVSLSRLREVSIQDLLRRPAVDLEMEAISSFLNGRNVLVTGAGGSIGSEMCRQVASFGPASLVLVEQAENALFDIHRELRSNYPDLSILPRIADVVDSGRMNDVFEEARPEVVLHAAAHKHVPMMEWNPSEAVKNNILGTRVVATLCAEHKADAFVLISTDKAVRPTSVMGATKRVAEFVTQSLAQASGTRFVVVRFGNVLGSRGSVVPIFQEQIARGGPVTVTHPDMRRFFMTIPEACQLVLQASTMGLGGEVFILKMGEPVKIVDLAEDLIRLSGLRPGHDIEIRFSGVRPGEKLYEELSTEDLDQTKHPSILVENQPPPAPDRVHSGVERLRAAAEAHDGPAIRAEIGGLVPGFHPGTGGRRVTA